MPRVIVTTETSDGTRAVVHDERVLAATIDTELASAQLVERVGWAVLDAEEIERRDAAAPKPAAPGPPADAAVGASAADRAAGP
jgi:hypothetical protein